MSVRLESFSPGGLAVVVGATGGLGGAFRDAIAASGAFADVLGLSRSGPIAVDVTDEATIAAAAARIAADGRPLRLVVDATGVLSGGGFEPEKTWRQLSAEAMLFQFAVNAVGPALLMKHVLPLFPREGKAIFATLSAKVGSIGDNQIGGWYGYRAAKAALNQIVKTASIELARRHREAAVVALHPGTVATRLSAPFAKEGLSVQTPAQSAAALLSVIDRLGPEDTGGFFAYDGTRLPW